MARPIRPFDPRDPFDAMFVDRDKLRIHSVKARRGPLKIARPTTANELLVDDAVRRSLRLSGLASMMARKTSEILARRVFDPIVERVATLAEVRALRDPVQVAVEDIVAAGMNEAHRSLAADLVQLADIEASWQVRVLARRIPLEVRLNRLSLAQVEAVATSKPFEGKLLRTYWNELAERTQRRVKVALGNAILDGTPTPEIVRTLRGTRANAFKDGILSTTSRQAESLVRTWTNHVSQTARRRVIEENTDVVGAWQFVATLDSRTTLQCIAHDGNVYEVGKGEIHRPPLHWGCRSTLVPVLKGWAELGLKEPPPTVRASMDGEVAGTVDYETWLRSKGAEFQDDVLGPARGKLFREGRSVDEMVTRTGRTLTLRELASADD